MASAVSANGGPSFIHSNHFIRESKPSPSFSARNRKRSKRAQLFADKVEKQFPTPTQEAKIDSFPDFPLKDRRKQSSGDESGHAIHEIKWQSRRKGSASNSLKLSRGQSASDGHDDDGTSSDEASSKSDQKSLEKEIPQAFRGRSHSIGAMARASLLIAELKCDLKADLVLPSSDTDESNDPMKKRIRMRRDHANTLTKGQEDGKTEIKKVPRFFKRTGQFRQRRTPMNEKEPNYLEQNSILELPSELPSLPPLTRAKSGFHLSPIYRPGLKKKSAIINADYLGKSGSQTTVPAEKSSAENRHSQFNVSAYKKDCLKIIDFFLRRAGQGFVYSQKKGKMVSIHGLTIPFLVFKFLMNESDRLGLSQRDDCIQIIRMFGGNQRDSSESNFIVSGVLTMRKQRMRLGVTRMLGISDQAMYQLRQSQMGTYRMIRRIQSRYITEIAVHVEMPKDFIELKSKKNESASPNHHARLFHPNRLGSSPSRFSSNQPEDKFHQLVLSGIDDKGLAFEFGLICLQANTQSILQIFARNNSNIKIHY